MVSHAKQSNWGAFGTAVAKENSYEIGSAAWCLGWLNNINNRCLSIQVICDNIKSGTALASSLTSQSQELDGMQEHHSLDSFWLPCARVFLKGKTGSGIGLFCGRHRLPQQVFRHGHQPRVHQQHPEIFAGAPAILLFTTSQWCLFPWLHLAKLFAVSKLRLIRFLRIWTLIVTIVLLNIEQWGHRFQFELSKISTVTL